MKRKSITNREVKPDIPFMTYICICAFLVFLCTLFPWSLDDWMWGSSLGIDLLKIGFKDYNGRYIGNFLAIVLTRSRFLRACTMAVVHTALLYILSELSGNMKDSIKIFSALLLLMPAEMIAEVIAWTSGFGNYVPSLLISLIYVYTVKNIFEEDMPKYRHFTTFMVFALGIAGALFVEHITMYNICLALFVIVYSIIRFKHLYITHISFLVGAVFGAIIMFSNSAYRIISQGNYNERTIAHGVSGVIDRAYQNYIKVIIPCGIKDSFVLVIAICVVACIISNVFNSAINRRWKLWHEISLYFIIAYTAIIIVENIGKINHLALWQTFEMVTTTLYLLTLIVFLFSLPVQPGIRAKLLFYLYSAIVLNGTLLIVTPIGPRCLYGAYVFLCLLVVSMLSIALDSVEGSFQKTIRISKDAMAICAIISVYYLIYIYGTIAVFEHSRMEKIKTDLARGDTTLYVQNMIFDEYVFHGNPSKGSGVDTWFKKFYGIDDSIIIENYG